MKAKVIEMSQNNEGEYVAQEVQEETDKKESAKKMLKKVLKGLAVGICGGIVASFFIVTASAIAASKNEASSDSDGDAPELEDLDTLATELAEAENENDLSDVKEEI